MDFFELVELGTIHLVDYSYQGVRCGGDRVQTIAENEQLVRQTNDLISYLKEKPGLLPENWFVNSKCTIIFAAENKRFFDFISGLTVGYYYPIIYIEKKDSGITFSELRWMGTGFDLFGKFMVIKKNVTTFNLGRKSLTWY